MKHRELSYRRQPIPPYPMQLRQNARPISRRELHALEFPAAICAHAQAQLIGILVAAEDGRGALEIGGDVVGVGDGERGRVESGDGDGGYAENPLVAAAPGVLDDEVAGQVLGLFERRRTGIGSGDRVSGAFHDRRRGEGDGAVKIGSVAAHGFDVGEMSEGVDTWRIVEAEKVPESLRR